MHTIRVGDIVDFFPGEAERTTLGHAPPVLPAIVTAIYSQIGQLDLMVIEGGPHSVMFASLRPPRKAAAPPGRSYWEPRGVVLPDHDMLVSE